MPIKLNNTTLDGSNLETLDFIDNNGNHRDV